MAKYLLDVNLLLALAWPSHEFDDAVHRWWTTSSKRWATCALTELGFPAFFQPGIYARRRHSVRSCHTSRAPSDLGTARILE
jgi:predicted nucleic acid-binding protein